MEIQKNISLRKLADREIHGEFGNGNERKVKLGYLYPLVQNIVNEKFSSPRRYLIDDVLIEQLAKKALNGVFGPINSRKDNLDYIYPRVHAKMIEIVQEELKGKTIEEIVKEVKIGKYGNGQYRKEFLGDLYKIVQNKVNESLGSKKRYELDKKSIQILEERAKKGEFGKEEINKIISEAKGIDLSLPIEQLAKKVIKGEFGNGKERKDKLGELYPIVQNKVNEMLNCDFRNDIDMRSIEILAKRVIKGEFGNGKERKKKLGELYPFVQNKVNEILGCNTIYEEKPIPNYIKV